MEPVDLEDERARLRPSEEEKRERKRLAKQDKERKISVNDFSLIRRVMTYAHAFRARIALAIFLGFAASLLTALNIMMVLPILQIMLGEEKTDNELDNTRAEIVEIEQQIEDAPYWKEIRYRAEREAKVAYVEWTEWIIEKEEKAIYYLGALIILAVIIKNILEVWGKYILQKSFYLANMRLKTDLYRRCLDLNMADMAKLTSGSLIARLNNDMRQVRQVFTNTMQTVSIDPFKVLAILGTMFFLNWRLTLIVALGLPFIVVPIAYIGKRLRKLGRKDEEEDSKVLGYTQEILQGLYIVKAFTGERREYKKFRSLSRAIAERQIRRERLRLYGEPFVEIMSTISMAAVLGVGGYIILKSDNAGMDAASFILFVLLMTRFYPPIKKFSGLFVKMQKGLASAERIFSILDRAPTVVQKEDAIEMPPFESDIVFENVTFSYLSDHQPALIDFSYKLQKGRKVAFVGSTGAGKSTVARLIPRFYDTCEGRILIDSRDIRDLDIRSLRQQMAVVSQDTILFNDTVFANIAYGKPDATDEEVVAAAQAAYAHEFIEKLPEGYATIIGERGGRLSGGQRQRLAIARALLADRPILILDEATSALDNESEAIVQRAIDKLMEGRTSLVIAHRLSTVRKADEIVVMHHGKIVERGTHDELLAKAGRYYELIQAEEFLDTEAAV